MKMTPEELQRDRQEQRKRRELKAARLCHRPSRDRNEGEHWYDVPPCGAKVALDSRGVFKCEKGHEWVCLYL